MTLINAIPTSRNLPPIHFFYLIMYIRGWILIVNINRPYSKNVSAQVIKTDVSREKGFDI